MKTNLQWFIYFVVTVTLTNRFCTAAEVQGKEDARKRQPVNMPGNEHFNHLRQYRREALTDYKIVSAEAMHDDIYPTSKIEPSALIQDAFTNHLINTLTSTDNNIELTGLDAVMGSRRSNGHKVQHNHFHEDNQDKVDHSNRDEEDQTFENDHHDYDANMDDRNMEYHRHKETHENTKSYHDHQNEISGIDHESVSYTPPGKNTASDDIELDLNHHPDSVSGEEKDLIEYRHYPNEYTTAKEDEKTKSIEAKPLKDDSTVGYNVDTEFLKKELSAIRQEDKKLDSVINAKYHAQRIEEDTLPEIEKEHHEMNVDNVMNDENEHNEENDERRDKTEANESKMDNIDDDADMDKATSELLDINVSTDGKITESPKIDKFTKESIFEKENLLPYLKLPKRNITTELIIKNSSSPIKTLITNTKEINNNNKIDVNINKGIVNINTQKIIEDIETLRDDLKSSLATSNRIINNEKMSEEAFNNYNIKKKSLIAFARIINRTVPQALILDAFSPVKRNTIDLRHTIKKSTLEHTSDTRKSYKRNDSAKIKKASFSQIKDRKINSRFQENINAYLLSEKHLHPTKHRFDKTQQDLLENMYRKPSKKYGHNKRLMHNSTAYTKQNMRDENGVKKSNKAKTEKRHQRTASHAHTHHYMPLSSTEHNVPQTSLYSRMHNGTAGKTHASIAQITSLNLNVSTPTVESRKSRKRQHHREKEKSKGLKDESNESKRQTIIAPNLFSADVNDHDESYVNTWRLIAEKRNQQMHEAHNQIRFSTGSKRGDVMWLRNMNGMVNLAQAAVAPVTLRITIKSSGCFDPPFHGQGCDDTVGSIMVNSEEISPNKPGFNFAVYDFKTGKMEQAVSFDTHGEAGAYEKLVKFLGSLDDWKIVCCAVKDDAKNYLPDSAIQSFVKIGATDILTNKIEFRSSYAFIGLSGPENARENMNWIREENSKAAEGPSTISVTIVTGLAAYQAAGGKMMKDTIKAASLPGTVSGGEITSSLSAAKAGGAAASKNIGSKTIGEALTAATVNGVMGDIATGKAVVADGSSVESGPASRETVGGASGGAAGGPRGITVGGGVGDEGISRGDTAAIGGRADNAAGGTSDAGRSAGGVGMPGSGANLKGTAGGLSGVSESLVGAGRSSASAVEGGGGLPGAGRGLVGTDGSLAGTDVSLAAAGGSLAAASGGLAAAGGSLAGVAGEDRGLVSSGVGLAVPNGGLGGASGSLASGGRSLEGAGRGLVGTGGGLAGSGGGLAAPSGSSAGVGGGVGGLTSSERGLAGTDGGLAGISGGLTGSVGSLEGAGGSLAGTNGSLSAAVGSLASAVGGGGGLVGSGGSLAGTGGGLVGGGGRGGDLVIAGRIAGGGGLTSGTSGTLINESMAMSQMKNENAGEKAIDVLLSSKAFDLLNTMKPSQLAKIIAPIDPVKSLLKAAEKLGLNKNAASIDKKSTQDVPTAIEKLNLLKILLANMNTVKDTATQLTPSNIVGPSNSMTDYTARGTLEKAKNAGVPENMVKEASLETKLAEGSSQSSTKNQESQAALKMLQSALENAKAAKAGALVGSAVGLAKSASLFHPVPDPYGNMGMQIPGSQDADGISPAPIEPAADPASEPEASSMEAAAEFTGSRNVGESRLASALSALGIPDAGATGIASLMASGFVSAGANNMKDSTLKLGLAAKLAKSIADLGGRGAASAAGIASLCEILKDGREITISRLADQIGQALQRVGGAGAAVGYAALASALKAVGHNRSPGAFIGGVILALAEQGAAPGTAGLAALAAGLGGSGADALAGGLGGSLPNVVTAARTNNYMTGNPEPPAAPPPPATPSLGNPYLPMPTQGNFQFVSGNIETQYPGSGPLGSIGNLKGPFIQGSPSTVESHHLDEVLPSAPIQPSQLNGINPLLLQQLMARFISSYQQPVESFVSPSVEQAQQHETHFTSPEISMHQTSQESSSHAKSETSPTTTSGITLQGSNRTTLEGMIAAALGHREDTPISDIIANLNRKDDTGTKNDIEEISKAKELIKFAGGELVTVGQQKDICDQDHLYSKSCIVSCKNKKALIGRFIDISSSEKKAIIKVNGEDWSKDEDGFNIVVLDFNTGEVEATETFDTEIDGGASKALSNFIRSLSSGKVILGATKGNAGELMIDDGYKALNAIGAHKLKETRLKSGDRYVLVGCVGDSQPWSKEDLESKGNIAEINEPIVVGPGALKNSCVCLQSCHEQENKFGKLVGSDFSSAKSEKAYADMGGDLPVAAGSSGTKRQSFSPLYAEIIKKLKTVQKQRKETSEDEYDDNDDEGDNDDDEDDGDKENDDNKENSSMESKNRTPKKIFKLKTLDDGDHKKHEDDGDSSGEDPDIDNKMGKDKLKNLVLHKTSGIVVVPVRRKNKTVIKNNKTEKDYHKRFNKLDIQKDLHGATLKALESIYSLPNIQKLIQKFSNKKMDDNTKIDFLTPDYIKISKIHERNKKKFHHKPQAKTSLKHLHVEPSLIATQNDDVDDANDNDNKGKAYVSGNLQQSKGHGFKKSSSKHKHLKQEGLTMLSNKMFKSSEGEGALQHDHDQSHSLNPQTYVHKKSQHSRLKNVQTQQDEHSVELPNKMHQKKPEKENLYDDVYSSIGNTLHVRKSERPKPDSIDRH